MKKILLLLIGIVALSCTEDKTIEGNWIQVMPPNLPYIQGVKILKHGTAESIGMATLIYESWHKKGDRLVLCGKSIGNGQTIDFCDTLRIIRVTKDSLITKSNSVGVTRYYKSDKFKDAKEYNLE